MIQSMHLAGPLFASPIALSATATEHGGQLVSTVNWTLRLLRKMCICGFANCVLAVVCNGPEAH